MKQSISVFGDGAWGTSMATLLAHNGHTVTLWCHSQDVATSINENHHNNHYLPDVLLSESIRATTDIQEALHDADWIFEAIPVKFLRSVLQQIKPYSNQNQRWVILSKGIETESCLLPSEIIDSVFERTQQKAVVSGPSFAHDLAHKKITAATIATPDRLLGQELCQLLTTHYFKPCLSNDLIGVQTGGALKNVVALAVGMLDAQHYTDNTKAFLITHALEEMSVITTALGGKAETLYGLSGVGDLLLTCMGKLSKNLELGKQLGSGKTLQKLVAERHGNIPEGINTVTSIYQIAKKHNLRLPLFQGVYACIFEGSSLDNLLNNLMTTSRY